MELPSLQPYFLLGLEKDVKSNIHFLSDEEILYPVGTVVTVHNTLEKKQRYIRLADRGKNLVQLNVSPNKKLIVISERSEKGPIFTLWDPVLFKKRRTFSIPAEKHCRATEFAWIEFSYDSKYIVAVTGDPDWTMYNIKCEKLRIESTARANNLNGTGTIEQVACNPNDTNQVALCGDQVLRCLGCIEFVWRQFGYNKLDPAHYTSCSWLSQDRLIVGSSRGKIMILETGEVRAVFHASDLPIINMKVKDDEEGTLMANPSFYDNFGLDLPPSKEDYAIRSITVFPKGFAFGYMNRKVHFFEKENPHRYKRRCIFLIPDRTIERDSEEEPKVITTVNSIAVTPSGDCVVASCGEMQLWTQKLFVHESMTGLAIDMEVFGYEQHLGPVADIAVCRWKPIALVVGALDRSIKIWNYETITMELIQTFEDDIYCVDLHPTGLYAVLGFSDKLRFMTIMIDEIVTTKEFNVRACLRCRFSTMGHLFAAANANIIQVFSSITFRLMYNLRGHNKLITGLDWSADDTILASCGTEGAMYLWNVTESARASETVVKTNPASVIRITNDGKTFYCVGMDGHIREVANALIQRDLAMPMNTPIDHLVLSSLNNMMFIMGNYGTIYSVELPLLEKIECIEFNLHKTSVLKGVLSYDDKYFISGSEDGCVFFWKLVNAQDKAIQKFEFVSANDILISKQILDEKMEQIRTLMLRMNELENEHSYQMKQNDALAASKLKDIHESYCSTIEDLKLKNEQMEADHIQEVNNINSQIAQLKRDHEEFIENLELSYSEKLMSEYEKFVSYEQKMEKMLNDALKKYETLENSKSASENAIIEQYEAKLKEKEKAYEDLLEAKRQQADEHEMLKQLIEEDADKEIYELKLNQQVRLREEQEANMKLRGDVSSLKKRFIVAQRDVEEYKQKLFAMENEHTKFKGFIMSLEQDISEMKKEIQERDLTIDEKEKRIFSLKNKNQELEKFKFILDFKIKELKSEIEPKERMITEQTTQINKMVRELENLQKIILGLDLQLEQLREKLNATNNEMRKEMDKNRLMRKSLQDIRIDIHQASGLIQNIPLLQHAVRNMYHKYNADKDFEVAQQEDTEAKSEFLRQRDFLERAVATLHYQATKNTNSLSYDKIRLVDENAALLEETNMLRKNLQSEVEQNRKLTSLAGMSCMTAQQAQQRVNFATATNKEIHKQYKDTLEQNAKTISAMKNENFRLLTKITEADLDKDHNEKKINIPK